MVHNLLRWHSHLCPNTKDVYQEIEVSPGKLKAAGLKLQLTKCEFIKKITYLGHCVSKEGVQTNSQKIKVIVEWPTLKNVTEDRSFLGFANYYRRFVKGYTKVAHPLNDLISGYNAKGKMKVTLWTEEGNQAFQQLKQFCSSTLVLAFADSNHASKMLINASTIGLGAVLYQEQGGL